ncbi:Carboxypeptidase Q [Pseudolycoriella hygida]|uniref:Carboxypeptidase Q n=1 Tax=Pseudolycoriella hygida TaxID=35572 RepID=A0A9Q0MID5_9DIPT|nr:Carboxypeptidase Q [Pseudolycoriella hygida]
MILCSNRQWQHLCVVILLSFSAVKCEVIDNEIHKLAYIDDECELPDKLRKEIHSYQPIVNKIADEVLNGRFAGDTYNTLSEFIDTFGPRYSGTKSLENAIDFMNEKLKEVGLENVHTENATIPNWQRGFESAQLVQPHPQNLPMLGIGPSPATPAGGIVADVVVVESFDELNSLSDDAVRGKIVVFVPVWVSYEVTVEYRVFGASRAARKGAAAALIRSIAPFSIGSPHAGWQLYEDDVVQIPAACITVEDAEMLKRIYRRGVPITIRLEMNAKSFEPFVSRNTVGELQGHTYPVDKKVVVLCGHLDSWDVGVGAMDDGGGAFISWKAVEYLKKLNLRPARTIRAILWTGEEPAVAGAGEYQRGHAATEKEEFNFFIESDIGTFEPLGLDFAGNSDAECVIKEILKLMTPLNATSFATPMQGGPDIDLWTSRGFPGASLLNKNDKYFWFHHTYGDSMLIENSEYLDKAAALFAASAYIIADLSIDMPRDLQ